MFVINITVSSLLVKNTKQYINVSNLREKSLFRLSHHCSFTVCGVLQSCHKGPGAEGQTILAFIVPSLMDGDERSSIQNHSAEKYTWLLGWTVCIKKNIVTTSPICPSWLGFSYRKLQAGKVIKLMWWHLCRLLLRLYKPDLSHLPPYPLGSPRFGLFSGFPHWQHAHTHISLTCSLHTLLR